MTSVNELSCIFCKENFEDKETLQIHFRKHGDPKFNQTAKAKFRAQNDSPTSSDTSKDDSEMVSCDVCCEVFPTISKAITHKHKVHPDHDAKYFCPWCGKLFTLKHLYNKHLESSHDTVAREITSCFHCDCCNVDFFVPSAMVYHNKFFHRQDREPSVGYSKKVKLVCQELVQIYYCPFCGEEYDNKVNLQKHMIDEHSDENQNPEDILRCPLCEAIFYHLDAYELHLTFHTSEDLYSEDNEMLKQIVEFSLDTVPPLMEKLEVTEENDDMNAMGIDQFLQLTMSKDPEEELMEPKEKVKSKKHKKHKKSKKTITLDEFLNMNTDVFGEGLNFQGIEEVPSRVVTKQLKSKKENPVKNNLKSKVLPSDIDKLKKQGIVIKMKSGKKAVPSTTYQQPGSSSHKHSPMKSNLISTSSEVLSKLMNQSNSQIKIVKKVAASNPNMEQTSNESNIANDPTNILKVTKDAIKETNYIPGENIDIDMNGEEEDFDNNVQDTNPDNNDEIEDRVKENDDSVLTETAPSMFSNDKALNEISESNDDGSEVDNLNLDCNNDGNIENDDFVTDISNSFLLNTMSEEVSSEGGQTLNDFEEDLVGTKILRNNTSEKLCSESHSNESSTKNVENNETSAEQKTHEVTNDTLNAIKHLSHLITVKSLNQSKLSPSSKENETVNEDSEDHIEGLHDNVDNADQKDNVEEKCVVSVSKLESQKEHTTKPLDALKNISKHVTIRSLASQVSSPKSVDRLSDESQDPENEDEADNSVSTVNLNSVIGRKVVNLKNSSKSGSPTHCIPKRFNVKKPVDTEIETNLQDDNTPVNTLNADLLRRLTNVTAKPIPSKMNIKQQHTVETSENVINIKKENNAETVTKHKKIDDEIEIFNIDDSDSDGQEKQDVDSEVQGTKLPVKLLNKTKDIAVPKSFEALRNLGKNITVKSKTQSSINQCIFKDEENFSDQNEMFSDENEDIDQTDQKINKTMNQFIHQSNKILQSTLKNLGKHITVKSRNSSPNLPGKQQDKYIYNNERIYSNDTESDSDSAIGKVKITEITDHPSDEYLSDEDDKKDADKCLVQYPTGTSSDVEDNCAEENPELFSDVETASHQAKVKMKTFEKPYQSPTSTSTHSTESDKYPISNFKKFNREITIKSVNDNKRIYRNAENEEGNASKDNETTKNLNKDLSVKPFRPNVPKYNIKSENQPTSSTIIEKVGATSNQVNTVNKEVSVKTFQSETVIEEITTTVTKTIRTVNQTVNQEVKNTSQTNINTKFKPQKIVNFNHQSNKNTQNVTVRHPSPSIGTKIKHAAPAKSSASSIRPTTQLVPIRPGLNLAKASSPAASALRNVTPSRIPQIKPVTGRPLKISPQAMNQSMKRTSQETTGQFSCFKKPKDFPIDASTSRSELDGDSAMHFSSTQSRSDFTTTVKSVKGKSLATSTQTKSEVSASAQICKLGNMSGLKIVKTSSKQATQLVEAKAETCGTKRTMEALQKLQMQGLLVKRPRTDDNDDNDFSDSDSENEG